MMRADLNDAMEEECHVPVPSIDRCLVTFLWLVILNLSSWQPRCLNNGKADESEKIMGLWCLLHRTLIVWQLVH